MIERLKRSLFKRILGHWKAFIWSTQAWKSLKEKIGTFHFKDTQIITLLTQWPVIFSGFWENKKIPYRAHDNQAKNSYLSKKLIKPWLVTRWWSVSEGPVFEICATSSGKKTLRKKVINDFSAPHNLRWLPGTKVCNFFFYQNTIETWRTDILASVEG